MGCKWYEWICRRREAEKSIPASFRQSHVRAEELLKRAKLAMAVDCATMHRRGECAQANRHCAGCSSNWGLGNGNEGGWCFRSEHYGKCRRNYDASVTRSGWCSISLFEESGDHVDCPVYKAWRGVILRSMKLCARTDFRLRNRDKYIYAAVGPEPGTAEYVFQDDDTNDPLSYSRMAREDRAAATRAARGDGIEAALEGVMQGLD